jgi:hypothetical protein
MDSVLTSPKTYYLSIRKASQLILCAELIIVYGIIMIIITDKTALFEPQPFLEDSASLHPVFTFFGFCSNIYF